MKTVLVVEDHALVRRGIRTLLEVEADMKVVGECGDGREAVRLFQRLKPDLVLMDVAMPNLNGIEAVRQMTAARPGAKIIMLSMHADGQYVVESFRAGAAGYVLKDAAFAELLSAIKAVRDGKRYMSPPLNEATFSEYVKASRGERGVSDIDVLSNREREVLQLIGEGNSSPEIAGKLEISVRTVETHRQHIMEKLHIHSVAGLTKFAIRHGICSL